MPLPRSSPAASVSIPASSPDTWSWHKGRPHCFFSWSYPVFTDGHHGWIVMPVLLLFFHILYILS